MNKLLVMGVGNLLLRDEGAGVLAVRALSGEAWPDNVTFMDGGTWSQDIFHLFKDYERMLILDVVASGLAPGSVTRLRESDLRGGERRGFSLHEINLLDALSFADLLGDRPELTILGIEPGLIEWGEGLSGAVSGAFTRYLEAARREIADQLEEMADRDGLSRNKVIVGLADKI